VASVAGGLGTPVGLVLLVSLAGDHAVMGDRPISRRLRLAGWVVTAFMSAVGLLFLVGALAGRL